MVYTALNTVRDARQRPQDAKPGIIYLACPYTHPNQAVREQRYRQATQAAARLIAQGRVVYSPITMTHPIDIELAGRHETLGSEYWVRFDEAFMAFCDEMVILRIPGWETSDGVARERRYFEELRRPVSFLDP